MKLRHIAFLAYALIGLGAAPACPVVTEEEWRALVCTGPTENIPDDDPALELFREAEPDDLAVRKVALAIERVNSCDDPPAPEGETK